MTFLTIFTAPKPFTNPHIATIQRNAIRSWLQFGEAVEVLLIGNEDGIGETAAEFGVGRLPEVRRNSSGTPLVSSIFALGREHGKGELLCYINTDILLMPDFVPVCRQVQAQKDRFLIVGQRWDLDVCQPLDFSDGWGERLASLVQQKGRRHPPGGSDYFVYPRVCFEHVPDFAIGRAGWDNWMLFNARYRGWALVEASEAICIVHQNHDYSHLPGGQPHYRLPESAENVRIVGGARRVFTLPDSDFWVVDGRVRRQPMTWQKFWREVEIFPLVRLHSPFLAMLVHAVYHPRLAYGGVRAWLRARRERSS